MVSCSPSFAISTTPGEPLRIKLFLTSTVLPVLFDCQLPVTANAKREAFARLAKCHFVRSSHARDRTEHLPQSDRNEESAVEV